MPDGVVYSGIGATLANPDARRAAAAIRAEISRLSREGAVSGAYFAWVNQSTNDTLVIDLLDEAKRYTLLLSAAALTLLIVAVVIAWQNRRIGVAKRAAEAARDRANRATEMKSEFVATVSHEIRTPMNGILATCSLLSETPLNGEQAEYAHTIQNSANALLQLIGGVLDLSKIESGKLQIEPHPFDLEELFEGAFELLGGQAREKGIDLFLQFDPAPATCFRGDSLRIRQIVLNLVGNAVKFTKTGHVLIGVRTRAADPGMAMLNVAVEDTGPGIAKEAVTRLFAKFVQAESSTSRKYGGTGLGLAISKRLVELMGGSIEAESTPGKGSRFCFELPLEILEEAVARKNLLAGKHVAVKLETPLAAEVAAQALEQHAARVSILRDGTLFPAALMLSSWMTPVFQRPAREFRSFISARNEVQLRSPGHPR